jgi:hypothetical protein
MEEQFYQITKHPSTFRIKSGVDKDGKIVARKCEVWWNGGAYADIGPRVTQKSGFTAPGPYDIDNVWIDSYALYTNLPAGRRAARLRHAAARVGLREPHRHDRKGARHGPGRVPPKNILRDGRPQATGTVMKDAAIEKVLDTVRAHELGPRRSTAAAAGQARPRHRHRLQGGDLADHVGRDRQRLAPTAAATLY